MMCWIVLCNGKFLGLIWIEGTMSQYAYKKLIEDKVWPLLRYQASRKNLYFMQDGVTCRKNQSCNIFGFNNYNKYLTLTSRVNKNKKKLWKSVYENYDGWHN